MQQPAKSHTMEKKDQVSATYDEMFQAGGFDQVFDLPYRHSCYFPMYKAVADELARRKASNVLEVGCGTGGLAHLLLDLGGYQYRGFDFSPVAVRKAIERTGHPELFCVADALNQSNYTNVEGAIVCTEVLEHIPNDLDLVSKWPTGTTCICSVPNFDSQYHERFFHNSTEVLERYGGLISIQSIKAIKKPVLADISLPNLLRHARWNRYKPRRLLEIVGLGRFDKVGGWFIFCGRKN